MLTQACTACIHRPSLVHDIVLPLQYVQRLPKRKAYADGARACLLKAGPPVFACSRCDAKTGHRRKQVHTYMKQLPVNQKQHQMLFRSHVVIPVITSSVLSQSS